MDANERKWGPGTAQAGIFGRKTGGGTVRNYEKREKREKWVGKCEKRQPHAEAWTTYGLST